MTGLESTLRRAARRDLAQRAIIGGGRGGVAGCGLALTVLLVDRGFGLGAPVALYGVLAGVGLIAGVVLSLAGSGDRFPLAVRLDHTFGLHDRLATAHTIDRMNAPRADTAFSALVRRDAETVAGRLDVARATPVRITPAWFGAVTLALVLGLGVVLLPEGPWRRATAAPAADPAVAAEERAAVVESIEDAVARLEEEAVLDEAGREDVDALRALADQLGAGGEDAALDGKATPGDVGKARDESAARLEELADRLADEAERNARAADELAERFRDLETARSEANPDTPLSTDELIDALQRGEFGEAGDLLDELTERAEALDEAERRRAIEALREAARSVDEMTDPMADPDRRAAAEQRERLEEILREQGLDQEAIDELLGDAAPPEATGTEPPPAPDARPLTREEIDEALQRRDVDEEVARDLAREIESYREQEALEDRVTEDTQRVADALDEAADQVEQPDRPADDRQPPPPTDSQESGQAEQQNAAEPQPGERQTAAEPQPGERQNATEQQPGEQPNATEQQPREQPNAAEQQSGEQPNAAEQQPGEQPNAAEQQPGEQPNAAEQQPGEQPNAAEQQPGKQPNAAEQQPGKQPNAAEQQPGEQPNAAEQQPGEQPNAAEQQPGEQSPSGTPQRRATGADAPNQRPGDALREIERRRRDAARNQDAAARARETARRLAENMTPEERREWAERWQQEMAGDGAAGRPDAGRPGLPPGATPETPPGTATGDDLSLTDDDDVSGRKVADWLDETLPATLEDATPAETAGRLRSARRAAERAVNESSVPPRYHDLIRRYFDRLQQSAPGTPAPDGAGNLDTKGGAANGQTDNANR